MTAVEARELSEKCVVYNEDQLYKTITSKIIVKCGEGSNNLFISSDEVSVDAVKRLLVDGYKIDIMEPISITHISW